MKFPADADLAMRQVLLGSVLLMDITVFEQED
jgi:hypothetical protein